jgi:phosphate transport system substrate-binding protein
MFVHRSRSAALPLMMLLPFASALAAETVRVKGSDTIGGALGPDLAEAYHTENPATFIEWEALGSSTAFVGLFDGTATIGASSRPINEAEQSEAKRRGLQLREWVIAYDGIAVLVHPSNSLASLTVDQVSKIFQGRIRNFRDVGGPDRPIRLIARPSYSGTHAFFKEKVVRKGNSKGPEEFAPVTEFVEHSAEIVNVVGGDPNAISFLGLGWVKPSVRAVPIAAGRGAPPIEASISTVRDGSYPVFRSLYLYTIGDPAGETRNLLAYILSKAGQRQVAENGFVQADATTQLAYEPARQAPAAAPVATASAAAPVPPVASISQAAVPAKAAAPAHMAPAPIRVFFTFGGARITDEAELRIEDAARQLQSARLRALVVGHADAQGSGDANDRISAARAGAVYQELRRLGIAPDRLSIQARGSSEPIATNVTLEGRQQNRRVDIILLDVAATASR